MIFSESGELRKVPMKPGVNIVTGESKTGKSALVEIMDYCLCSSRSTIPKGKITDFAYLYVLPMLINEHTYVIARYKWQNVCCERKSRFLCRQHNIGIFC